MTRPEPLSAAEIATGLAELPAWSGDTTGIGRTQRFESMTAAARAVLEIARQADRLDHHPDVDLRYRTVDLSLRTHDVGGVTELDLQLARVIDGLLNPSAALRPQDPPPGDS